MQDPPTGSVPTGSITVERQEGRVVVRLRGEIDITLRPQAERALDIALGSGLPVVVVLTEVRLVGATGVAFLVQCARVCAREQVPCTLRGVPASVRRVLVALDLQSVLAAEDVSHVGV